MILYGHFDGLFISKYIQAAKWNLAVNVSVANVLKSLHWLITFLVLKFIENMIDVRKYPREKKREINTYVEYAHTNIELWIIWNILYDAGSSFTEVCKNGTPAFPAMHQT